MDFSLCDRIAGDDASGPRTTQDPRDGSWRWYDSWRAVQQTKAEAFARAIKTFFRRPASGYTELLCDN